MPGVCFGCFEFLRKIYPFFSAKKSKIFCKYIFNMVRKKLFTFQNGTKL